MIGWILIQSAAVVATALAGYVASLFAGTLPGILAALASGGVAIAVASSNAAKHLLEVQKLREEIEKLRHDNRTAKSPIVRPSSEEVRKFGIPAAERDYPLLDHIRRIERIQVTPYIASETTLPEDPGSSASQE